MHKIYKCPCHGAWFFKLFCIASEVLLKPVFWQTFAIYSQDMDVQGLYDWKDFHPHRGSVFLLNMTGGVHPLLLFKIDNVPQLDLTLYYGQFLTSCLAQYINICRHFLVHCITNGWMCKFLLHFIMNLCYLAITTQATHCILHLHVLFNNCP